MTASMVGFAAGRLAVDGAVECLHPGHDIFLQYI